MFAEISELISGVLCIYLMDAWKKGDGFRVRACTCVCVCVRRNVAYFDGNLNEKWECR